jgi:predicted HTH domain antitoxin
MSDEKQQDSIAEKEKEVKHNEGKGKGYASKQEDIQVKVSTTTKIPTSENTIEPVVVDDTITVNNFVDVTGKEEEDLTIKVRNAGDAFYDLVISAIEKAKNISVEKAKELVSKDLNPAAIEAKKDAQDIATVGESVESLARTFESLMTEIRKQTYSEQVNLLTGYKKLLNEQINVIDTRIRMTERLSNK